MPTLDQTGPRTYTLTLTVAERDLVAWIATQRSPEEDATDSILLIAVRRGLREMAARRQAWEMDRLRGRWATLTPAQRAEIEAILGGGL